MSRVKVKDSENLTDSNIKHVISLLNADKPITKKEACAILNISYNTARLNNIIEQYTSDAEFRKKMRKKLRGTKVSDQETANIVGSFLSGEALSSISKSTFRSVSLIKEVLESNNIPARDSEADYFNPMFLPDSGIKELYSKGDLVFSARYNSAAIIRKLYKVDKEQGHVYGISILGTNQMNAYQPYYELSDLTHLQHNLRTLLND